MANDFDPEEVSIPRIRAILDFNKVTDSYYRRWQQTALFQTRVVPKVKVRALTNICKTSKNPRKNKEDRER
jgi:hypothetical protein